MEIYNLVDRETMLKENLFSERNLMIFEDIVLKGDSQRIIASRYSISSSRVKQIKDYCLFRIKKYYYNLKE